MPQIEALRSYQTEAAKKILDKDSPGLKTRLCLGLIGELGGLLAALKKRHRDENAFLAFEDETVEEFGDAFWYFTALCHLLDIRLTKLSGAESFAELQPDPPIETPQRDDDELGRLLLELSSKANEFCDGLSASDPSKTESELAKPLLEAFVRAATDGGVSLQKAASLNLKKISDRWPSDEEKTWGALYDEGYAPFEQLPRQLSVEFREVTKGEKAYLYPLRDGIPLGDRLTDNRGEEDFYRYHDVFHMSYAAILGWSPVLRSLLRVKRKSDPAVDEQQDGARATIAEEGISNWIFAQGEQHNFFAEVDRLDFHLLKAVKKMTQNYEVRDRPYWMWERAILRGFDVFRELKSNRGGIVTIDLNERSIEYDRSAIST